MYDSSDCSKENSQQSAPFLVSTTVYAVLLTVDSFRVELPNGSNDLLLPASALRALLYIPLMSTNVFATLLICYKAWYVH